MHANGGLVNQIARAGIGRFGVLMSYDHVTKTMIKQRTISNLLLIGNKGKKSRREYLQAEITAIRSVPTSSCISHS